MAPRRRPVDPEEVHPLSKRQAAIRRLLADLSRSDTRGSAVRRIRSRAAREWRTRTGGSVPSASPGAGSTAGGGRRPDSWYVGEWSRLAGTILGEAPGGDPPLDFTRAPETIKQAARQRAQAAFADAVARGEGLEGAVYRGVADLTEVLEWHAAWSLAEGAGRLPGGQVASAIGHAVLHHRRRQFDRVWTTIRDIDDVALTAFLPIEAVDAGLAVGTAEGGRRALAVGIPTATMDPAVLVDLAGRFLAFDESERAAHLLAELHRRSDVVIDDRRRYAWTLIERWLQRTPTDVPGGAIPVAVIDYQTPDHVLTSGNVGDYVQTLAMLGNLVLMPNVAFTGEDGLGEVANDLQRRVPSSLQRAEATGSIHLIPVDRDFSSAADIPVGTWMIAFGWHMHSLFDLRSDFPYHPNIRPLFVSFHVSRLEMLTEEAKDYLRRHGPVGCRDWTTVFLLLSAGIDAFFSGCLTTTVDALFPPREAVYRGKGAVGVIDLSRTAAGREARDVRVYSHQSDEYRYMSASEGIRAADVTLAAYQRDLDRVVTGRLHAYLPLTSLGVPVEFKTSHPGDVRFAGLLGFQPGDPRLDELRTGIRALIGATFERILGGASEDEVYALWRDLTRDQVAEAKARFKAPVSVPPTTIDVAGAVATAADGSRRSGPHDAVDPATVTDVVLAYDQNLTSQAAVLIESIVTNASGPVRLWILGRGLTRAYQDWLGGAFPALPITFLPCDGITYGAAGTKPRRLTARITISTMDRLLLPVMLQDVSRLVYVDVDTIMLGDVCHLAKLDLAGTPVAARDSNVSEDSEWRRAGRSLPEDLALELRRGMGLRHGYGHAALNAGVLVMDLDRMRRDDFTNRVSGLGGAVRLPRPGHDAGVRRAGTDGPGAALERDAGARGRA